jgi:NADPH-dependent glutamate synthase beta subunit-like oxidoreductase
VAVIGAGPTGLTCAFYLTLLGHDVTVYESHAAAGGMLRYALPEYRLPKDVLDHEIGLIERMGVKFIFNCMVGTDITLNELDERYDTVFLSIGTWKEAWVYLPGTELQGVIPALNFLEAVARNEPVQLGRRVVIIGGGNAAIDSARTALRMGSAATVIYRRERKDMPAIKEETEAAAEEGAHFIFLAAPHRIVGENGKVKAIEVVKTRLGEFDASGRRRPIPTEEIQSFKCDSVILAVGETVDNDFVRASGLKIKESGTVEVDRYTLETSREKFYAGGDVITGASNVSNAMGTGKKAARLIDERLTGERRFGILNRKFEYDQRPPAELSQARRHRCKDMPAAQRVKSFQEATLPITATEAVEEAARCLRCDIRESARNQH